MNAPAWPCAADLARVQAWMDTQGLGEGPIRDAALLTGGTQNLLLHMRRGDTAYVLRRPPMHARREVQATIEREARVLAALKGSRVPHPELIGLCLDCQVQGVPFYLMAPIDGFNASGRPLPAPHADDSAMRRRMGLSMVDALLRLAEIDPFAVGLEGFGKPVGFLERQVERWSAQLDHYRVHAGWSGPASLPGVAEVAAWLKRHQPAASAPGILHGDFHLANVMFSPDAGEVAAVIDWELATVGDPLLDLGWLVATWPDAGGYGAGTIHVSPWQGFADAAELVEHYRQRSPRDLSAIAWYVVLARFKLGILLEGSHARACAGKAPFELGQKHHRSALKLFESARATIAQTPFQVRQTEQQETGNV